jgi:hypothetical protein
MRVLIGSIIAIAVAGGIIAVVYMEIGRKEGSGLSDAFDYNLDSLRRTDPSLILYEEGAKINTGLENPIGVAVGGDDTIYVAGDKSIRVFNRTGNLVGGITLPESPRALTVAGESLYIAMTDHVEVYDSEGGQKARWESMGERAFATSIAVSGDNVFVADMGNRIVLRYTTSGDLLRRIGAKDEVRNIPGFVVPSPYFDLAVSDDGLLRVANPGRHRIEAYTFDGDLEIWWGKSSLAIDGFCGCCNPVNFAIMTDGSFVTCEKGLTRVKIYDYEGNFVGVVAGPESFVGSGHACEDSADCQTGGLDVAVDSLGRVLVLDPHEGTVRIFTRIGTVDV